MFQVINKLPCRSSKPYHFLIDHMMNYSIFLLYCLLTFSLYILSQNTSSSPDVVPIRTLRMGAPVHKHETQVAQEAMESTPAKEDSTTLEYGSNSYNPHDLIYHIDYHGVTTHPTPKHPKTDYHGVTTHPTPKNPKP